MENIGDVLGSTGMIEKEVSQEERQQMQNDMLDLQIQEDNDVIGNLKGYDCPICKNRGYIKKRRFFEPLKCDIGVRVTCECMPIRESLEQARKSGLGSYLNMTLDDFVLTENWQRIIKQKAENYLKDNNESWFAIVGQSGAGKTLICTIIATDLLINKKRDVLFITWTDFIGQLKRDLMSDNANKVSRYLEEIKTADVLFIDELLKEYSPADLKYIVEIINHRYMTGRKTIITSEFQIGELLDINEAVFGRVIEVSGDYLINIPKDRSKNQRLKGVL